MTIHSTEDKLPDYGIYVLCHVTRFTWQSNDPQGVQWKVLRMERDDSGHNTNNLKLYMWTEFGPGNYFGQ